MRPSLSLAFVFSDPRRLPSSVSIERPPRGEKLIHSCPVTRANLYRKDRAILVIVLSLGFSSLLAARRASDWQALALGMDLNTNLTGFQRGGCPTFRGSFETWEL